MFRTNDKPSRTPHPGGFTLTELMIAMALALIVLGIAFTFFNDLYNTSDLAGSMADVNENLRAAVNAITTDLATSGMEIPLGGIPVPNGGSATPINRPGPAGSGTFPATGALPVISPGAGLGPTTGSSSTAVGTDLITMISVNQSSLLDQYPLTNVTASSNSATITVDSRTNIASGVSQAVPGQLIMLSNVNSSCLLTVTGVNSTNIITFAHGDPSDFLGLNQFTGATSGTINQLKTGGSFPSTTAYHINMVTYYLDNSTPHRLMRQFITSAAQPVALGINVLQFSYSLSPPAQPIDPTRSPSAPNQIRKVNVWVIGQADHPNRRSGRYFSNSIATSVTIQNLAYYNKY